MKNLFKYFIYLFTLSFTLYLGSCTPDSTITGPDNSIDESLLDISLWSLVVDTFEVADSNSYIEIISEVSYDEAPVSDSTRVTFFTNLGEIEGEQYTVDGQAVSKLYPKDNQSNLLSGELKVIASVGKKIFSYDTLDLYVKVKSGIDIESIVPSEGGDLILNEGESLDFICNATAPGGITPSFVWKVDGEVVSTIKSYTFVTTNKQYQSGEYTLDLEVSYPGVDSEVYQWSIEVTDVVQGIKINSYLPSNSDPVVIDEGGVVNFAVDAVDLDGGDLNYSWKLNNEVVSTTSSYNFVTNYSSEGSYTMLLHLSTSTSSQYLNWNIVVNNKDQEIIVIEILPNDGGNLTMDEGETKTFSINATDPDGGPLAYKWYIGETEVSTMDNFNFITSYLPATNSYSAGEYLLRLDAIDVDANTTTDFSWAIEVKDVDRPIVVDQLLPGENGTSHTLAEGDSLRFSIDAYDPDGNTLSYNWKLDGTTLSTESSFYYKPDYQSSGGHSMILLVEENSGKGSLTSIRGKGGLKGNSSLNFVWSVNVDDKNGPIVISDLTPANQNNGEWEPINQVINETESIDFSVTATDLDEDIISYVWKIGSEIVSHTETYQFVTDYNSSGTYILRLGLSDGDGFYKEFSWDIKVNDSDTPIIVNSITPEPCDCVEMNEGDTQEFVIDAYDPDGKELNYLWKFDDQFVSMENSWSYTADYESAGDHTLNLTVSDDSKNTLNYVWEIVVTNVDRAIIVNDIQPTSGGNLTIFETETIDFSIDAYDPDGNDLTYDWQVNNTSVSNSSSYQFVTDYNSAGDYNISLNVMDGFSKNQISYFWYVKVNEQSTNISVLSVLPSAGGDLTTDENQAINFNISAKDPTNEPLNYSYKLDNVEVSTDSTYQFITDYDGAGEYQLILTVWNNLSKDEISYTWDIEVFDVDRAIVVSNIDPSPGSSSLNEGEQLNFSIVAYDPDGNDLTYQWKLDDELVSETSEYSYLPNFDSAGDHEVTLTVNDGFGAKSILEYEWDISVVNVDRAIVINSLEPQVGIPITINQNESVGFSIDAYDPDGTPLNYSWRVDGIEQSQLDNFTFTTNQNSNDSYEIQLVVTNGGDEIVVKSWEINVNPSSIIITELLPNSGGDLTIDEGQSIFFSITAFDQNGGGLEYEWIVNGEVESTDDSYHFESNSSMVGAHNVKLKVSSETSILLFSWDIEVKEVDLPISVVSVEPSNLVTVVIPRYETETFSVEAYDLDDPNEDLFYSWKLNGVELVEFDSSYTHTFDEEGDYELELTIFDGDSKSSVVITWNIEVQAQN